MRFKDIYDLLKNAGIDNAQREAALLAEKFCGISPSSLLTCADQELESEDLLAAIRKRTERYPLQYILGEWYFFGEKYILDESCLVPRPDTELLVELAIERLPRSSLFADLCTGSGCVAISTLAHRPDCTSYAFELFEGTLEMAKKNAVLNGVEDRFIPVPADVLEPINIFSQDAPPFDAILSNPPYIKTSVIETLEKEVKHEPYAALDGGEDGLLFYREILKNHSQLLKKEGFIAFEIGYDQGGEIRKIAAENSFDCEIIKDYGGCDRVAFLKRFI